MDLACGFPWWRYGSLLIVSLAMATLIQWLPLFAICFVPIYYRLNKSLLFDKPEWYRGSWGREN